MAEKNALIRFWETLEKQADGVKIKRAARSLQRQAEIDVADALEAFENEEAKYEEAKVKAKEDHQKGFKNIYESFMALKVKKKRYEDAVEVYKNLFEEEPKLV
jgi:hypothetical protein